MNRRVQAPYGDIFSVDTPKIDEMGERLYAERRMQEQQRLVSNRAMDDEFSKNLSNIRDADIDDLTNLYNDWKTTYKNIEKLGERATPKDQMEAIRKKGEIYKLINESKEYKNWLESQGKQVANDKRGTYADSAAQQLIERTKLATRKTDRGKDADLLYPYSVPDIGKDLKAARGESPRKVVLRIGESKDDKFKDDAEEYTVGNNPAQFFNNLFRGVVTGGKGKNFSGYVLNQYEDNKLQELSNKFQAKINDPKFKQVYGEFEDFPQYAYQTPEGKAAMITTMEEFVNAPLIGKSVKVDNKERITANRQQFAQQQQARSAAASLQRMREMIAARQIPWMNATQTADYVINADNTVGTGQVVESDAEKFETITGVKPNSNSELRSDGQGGYVYGVKTAEGFREKGKVDGVLAKDRLTKNAAKNLVPNSGGSPIRLPKDITKTKMVTMVLPDGRTGQIPEEKVSQFLKENPKAKRQ